MTIGIPLHGRTWTLRDALKNRVGDIVTGLGTAGPYTKLSGILGYNEICELTSMQNWTTNFDVESQSPFAVNDDQWISYDDIR